MTSKFVPVTEEELTTPPPGHAYVESIRDAWWPHDDQGRFFLYTTDNKHFMPQSNRHREIAENVGKAIIPNYAGVKQLDQAFVKMDLRYF